MSKAALYKTILASYSKSNTDDEQSVLRGNKGLGKGLYSKNGAKRRLRKSRRSKSKFFPHDILQSDKSCEKTLQGLATAMCPHGGSGGPAGDLSFAPTESTRSYLCKLSASRVVSASQ